MDSLPLNQSVLKEISPEYSLEGLMMKLKLQYFGHLMQRTDSFEKTLMLGKIEGRRKRGWQRMRCWMASLTQWTWVWVNSGSWQWTTPAVGGLQSMGSQRVGHFWATELNWTEPPGEPLWNVSLFRVDYLLSDFNSHEKTLVSVLLITGGTVDSYTFSLCHFFKNWYLIS